MRVSESQSKLDRLLEVGVGGPVAAARRGRKHEHPPGWVPGVTLSPEGGSVVTVAEAAPPDWDGILRELLPPGVDPAGLEVDPSTVEIRAWDANVGGGDTTRLYYFKARVRRKSAEAAESIDDLVAAVRRARPRAPRQRADEERVYFLHLTDLQAGQADGDGAAGMVARVLELGDLVRDDLERLRASGRPATAIFVPITGDLVEGISGWYEMQTFSVTLDRRQQTKLVRRLLTELLVEIAKLGLPVHVAVVPGNHGENRRDGKAFTTLGDNDDVAVLEQVAEAFAIAGRFPDVTFSFPEHERLSLTVEVLGHVVGLTHGHIARGSGSIEARIAAWFKNMAAARDPLGDSDLLFTGHYHHARAQQLIGDTVWVQGGALCDLSDWFSQSAGLVSDPAVVRGTITREQALESVLIKTWPRSRPATKEVPAA